MGRGQTASARAPARRTPSDALKLVSVLALLSLAATARPDASNGIPTQFHPSFPVFGSGKLVNFLDGDNQAVTNAAAHVGFSLAIPLLGEHFWGRKGLWATGLSWMALTLLQESLFHAPANPGPGYAAEVRSDLITRLLPCATLLVFDALRGRGHASMSPGLPPEAPGRPWPIGLELPRPDDGSRSPASELATHLRVGDPSRSSVSATVPVRGDPVRAALDDGVWDAVARRAAPPGGCTTALLFQGDAACSWDAPADAEARGVATR